MSKILYISVYNTDPQVLPFDGVMKKIALHIDAFNSYGNTVDYVETDGSSTYFVSDNKRVKICNYTKNPFLYFNRLMKATSDYIKKNRKCYDYVYIRHGALSYIGYLGLKTIYKHSKKIYLEIPTYYEPEKSLKNYIKFYFNKKLHKYVYKIVTDCNERTIYGIYTIMITNGTDTSKISPRKPTADDSINVALVASISDYHGVDKIITALESYINSEERRKVVFHIVGTGPKIESYMESVSEKQLSDYIKFYGKLGGDELFSILDKCEIGISSLSNKEIGVTFSSTLKSKEYLSKGIPIIADVMLDVFYDDPQYFFHQLESEFSIPELIDFYNCVYVNRSKQEVIDDIRSFAEKKCDIYQVLKALDDDYKSAI